MEKRNRLKVSEEHLQSVAAAITEGEVVPLLGAGVNLSDRPEGQAWKPGHHLPSGSELASYLAEQFNYPTHGERLECACCRKMHTVELPLPDQLDLSRVSQYAEVVRGSLPLYKKLQGVFDFDYPPTQVHRFLARLPARLRSKRSSPHQLIVTTNYDDLLERAFKEAGEPFEVVAYVADGEQRGRFIHTDQQGQTQLVERPNESLLSTDNQSIILKIHGAVCRGRVQDSSFVITEDHYIAYLTTTELTSFIPKRLAERMKDSSFLFLGYSLRDWNLRVILHRLWGTQRLTCRSWAVQLNPQLVDEKAWLARNVEIIDAPMQPYVAALEEKLRPGKGAGRVGRGK